jgi:hypothetical protein
MVISALDDQRLLEGFSIIDHTPEMEETIVKLRDFLSVDHLVYHSSKMGASPSADPYVRLTYPASWIKRYLTMGYVDVARLFARDFCAHSPSIGAN